MLCFRYFLTYKGDEGVVQHVERHLKNQRNMELLGLAGCCHTCTDRFILLGSEIQSFNLFRELGNVHMDMLFVEAFIKASQKISNFLIILTRLMPGVVVFSWEEVYRENLKTYDVSSKNMFRRCNSG